MITEFLDGVGASAHDRFQAWRTEHQSGIFLAQATETRAVLHGAQCQHLGSGPPYYVLEDGFGSLTSKRKVCASHVDLIAWATSNGISVQRCQHCVRDRLITIESAASTDTSRSEPLDVPEELVGLEGAQVQRLMTHRRREQRLRDAKIQEALGDRASLVCEVPGCGFDFERIYGSVGRGYAQVHHRFPLSESDEETQTTLADLAVVCANCHAMIHRGGENRPLHGLIATA